MKLTSQTTKPVTLNLFSFAGLTAQGPFLGLRRSVVRQQGRAFARNQIIGKLRSIGMLGAIACLGAIAPVEAKVPTSPIAQIRGLFGYYLKDPRAVQIEIEKSNKSLICGRYNAKNSFGAYTGFKPFAFDRNKNDLYLAGVAIRQSGSVYDISVIANEKADTLDAINAKSKAGNALLDLTESKLLECANA